MKALVTLFLLIVSMLSVEKVHSQSLKIEAYVVYDNGKESKKNLLSNNPMEIDNAMLYNIDAGQTNPDDLEGVTSTKLKVVIRTQDVVDIVIKKGKKTAIDKKGQSISGVGTFYVDDIVCVPVGITVKKGNKVIGKKTIDFQCGE
ncbi:MAG: hypothetical protein RJA11_1373 [Bacteroidota bacterium]|jgi:hypothetical protein